MIEVVNTQPVKAEARVSVYKKVANNNDIIIDDFDENNDTLYETPFVSFMNNSSDDINTTPNNKQYQPRASLITKGLLTQGILDESCESENDLTPTIEIKSSKDDAVNRARTLEKR
jgi:hypothetical protein